MASYRGMTLYSNHLCRMLSTSKFTANNSVILVSRGCVSFNGVIHRNFSINGNRILLQKLKPNEKSSLTESKSDGGLQTSFTKKGKPLAQLFFSLFTAAIDSIFGIIIKLKLVEQLRPTLAISISNILLKSFFLL